MSTAHSSRSDVAWHWPSESPAVPGYFTNSQSTLAMVSTAPYPVGSLRLVRGWQRQTELAGLVTEKPAMVNLD